jgi:uncharacterized protein with beta-barrel porin domain
MPEAPALSGLILEEPRNASRMRSSRLASALFRGMDVGHLGKKPCSGVSAAGRSRGARDEQDGGRIAVSLPGNPIQKGLRRI